MLYYLFDFLEKQYQLTGASVFQYLSFRASLATLMSLFIAMVMGKRIIAFIRKKQIGEEIRDLGLEGQSEKAGTPTMGGLIIILALLTPVLLFADISNVYIQLLIVSTVWMGAIGFIDDYIKVFRKDKEGLKSRFKLIGQSTLGLIVGVVLYTHPEITIKQKDAAQTDIEFSKVEEVKSLQTNIPFFKGNEFDYSDIITALNDNWADYAWLIFIPIVIFIVTAVSNGANLTDGIDGLAAGSSAIIVLVLMIFAWVSGNILFSDYLNIMYIPRVGELVIFCGAFVGALIGFMWYNTYPAQVFMGDTGSLTIGGLIAVIALIVRKELLIPLLCGIFFAETLSVMIQVVYFKRTKKKYGEGKRVFLMAPLHHHYQKIGMHESKIVNRFLIVGVILAVLTIVTLKVR
ncbi:MAG: phospho-N-acetylmuramoyl-pentapeptide-transferase [Flavobacteriaceae bacterium]|jgi:phospho-N-acetylmuramoyl-pentapeptide-transferase|nr:phospho-N-acetylmuramoyl-pentapeptide-transferase [Flavobacteriaceae bacterium]